MVIAIISFAIAVLYGVFIGMLLRKIWEMTGDVKKIMERVTKQEGLTYYVVRGEKDKVLQAAKDKATDLLYQTSSMEDAPEVDDKLERICEALEKLGLADQFPEALRSRAAFHKAVREFNS